MVFLCRQHSEWVQLITPLTAAAAATATANTYHRTYTKQAPKIDFRSIRIRIFFPAKIEMNENAIEKKTHAHRGKDFSCARDK